jgi:hypothetical protein
VSFSRKWRQWSRNWPWPGAAAQIWHRALIRVMVEGEHEQQVRDMAERIAKQVESAF